MAPISLVLAGVAPLAYIIYFLIERIVTAHRREAKARDLGCQEPIPDPEWIWWKFGIDIIRSAMNADVEQRFPDYVLDRARHMGVYTWRYRIFGNRVVTTHEPENIQALLATQFGTFDLGPLRRGTVSFFVPLIIAKAGD